MSLALTLAAVAVAALLTFVITRALAAREIADARVAFAADLATARQDNVWLQKELERQQQTLGDTRAMLDKADANLRDAFQSLAAEALNSNRGAFLDLARTAFEGLTQNS